MADARVFLQVLSPGPRADRLREEIEAHYKVRVSRGGLEAGAQGVSVEDLPPMYYFEMPGYTPEEAAGALPIFLMGVDEGWQEVINVMFPASGR
jgi:hypothetical protein